MSINWGKLYAEGRCREVGVSWTEEEAKALFVDKTTTAEELRAKYYPEKIAEMQEAIEEHNPIIEEEVIEELVAEEKTLEELKQEATDM